MHDKEPEEKQATASLDGKYLQILGRFEAILHNSRDAIIVHDFDGRFQEWNDGAEKIYGYTREEALTMNISELTSPDDLAIQKKYYDALLASTDDTIEFETHRMAKDGSIKSIWLTATKLTEMPSNVIISSGYEYKPNVISLVERDITERKRVEKELEAEKSILRASLESSQDGIVVFDESGKLLSRNQRLIDMWDISNDEVKTMSDEELINFINNRLSNPQEHWDTGKQIEDNIQESSREDILLIDGRIFDHYKAPMIDTEGINRGSIWFYHDVSKLRVAEKKLQTNLNGITAIVSQMVEMKDPYTSGHQNKVSQLSVEIGQRQGLVEEQIENLRMSALIHDIGKMAIPSEILSKPGKLLPIEFELIKAHPKLGYLALNNSGLPETIRQGILQHHERIDGSGYPEGLKGDKILFEAKILGIADVVDAISSDRPYRPALGIDVALDEITKNSGILYDPEAVDACLDAFEQGFSFKV